VGKERLTTSQRNVEDFSYGWEAIAQEFISSRSSIGLETIENWGKSLEPRQVLLDVGCGFGDPYTQYFIDKGVSVYGIDASKTLVQEYERRFPEAIAKCESAETSPFFDKKFDAILSVGLIFLLPHSTQILVLRKMAVALKEGGNLLFSSPCQIVDWDDLLTGRKSMSLGREKYINTLNEHDLSLINEYTDEGNNHYYYFQKSTVL
jgi:SAM-dependent methyltransferase